MMKLDEFVAQTIQSIVRGVSDSQAPIAELGGRVNPFRRGTAASTQSIEFDVELSTTQGTETKGGLGVFVGVISAGTGGKSDSSSTSVGRVRFAIPLALPTTDAPDA